MKKLLIFLMAAAVILSLSACGGDRTPPGAQEAPAAPSQTPEETPGPPHEGEDLPPELPEGTPAVEVLYEEDVPEGDREVFREEPTDYDQGVVFRANVPVTDFRFFIVEWGGEEEGWGPVEGESLYTQAELSPERELLVVTSFPGDMPSRGISYTLNGERLSFTLGMSGYDGSLYLEPIPQPVG